MLSLKNRKGRNSISTTYLVFFLCILFFFISNNFLVVVEAKIKCDSSNTLPGARIIASGFNARNGPNVTAPGEHAGLLPVFEMDKYSMGQTYTPPGHKSVTWCVPDSLYVNHIGESVLSIVQSVNSKFSESLSVYREKFDLEASIKYEGFKGAVNYEHQLAEAHEHLENQTIAQSHSIRRYSHYSIQAYPPNLLKLHPMFKREVDSLPDQIKTESDRKAYQDFIDYFGTHYIYRIIMGGEATCDTYFNATLVHDYGQKWVSNQLKLTFSYDMFGIGGGLFKNRSNIHISQEFSQYASTYVLFEGGKTSLQKNGTLPAWADSTVTIPAALNYSLSSLDNLITDNPSKSKTMHHAIFHYIVKGSVPGPSSTLLENTAAPSTISNDQKDKSTASHTSNIAINDNDNDATEDEVETVAGTDHKLETVTPASAQNKRDDTDNDIATYRNENTNEENERVPVMTTGGVGSGFDWKAGVSTLPVLKFTYDQKKTWTSPFKQNTYVVPDQLVVSNTPEANIHTDNEMVKNMTAFQSILQKWHSIDIGIPDVIGFHESKSMGIIKKFFEKAKSTVFIGKRSVSLFKIQMWPFQSAPNQEKSKFEQEIDFLPDDCNDKPYACKEFVDSWGEFYAPEGQFGGEALYMLRVNDSLIKETNISWVDKQVSFYFNFIDWKLGFGFGYNHSELDIAHIFSKNIDIKIVWHNWNDSSTVMNSTEIYHRITNKPLMIRPRLRPITELIHSRPALQRSLSSFIDKYLQQKKNTPLSPRARRRRRRYALEKAKHEEYATIPVTAQQANRPVISGMDFLGRGFDATTEQPRGMPVWSFTYDMGITWKNPYHPEEVYRVPDQVAVVDDPISSNLEFEAIYTNVSDYLKEVYHHHSHHGFLGFGSHSKTTFDFYQKYYQLNQVLLLNYTSHAWYQLKTYPVPPPSIDSYFKSAVNNLPAHYNSDNTTSAWKAYHNFLITFGTHYMKSATMGGNMKVSSWFDSCFLVKYDHHWVTKQSGWSIFNIIGGSSGKHSEHVGTTLLWDQYSETTMHLRGGNPLLFKAQDMDEWTDSIYENMFYVDYDIELLSNLIDWDSTRKASLASAIHDYIEDALESSKAIGQSFVPPNPHKEPAWCPKS